MFSATKSSAGPYPISNSRNKFVQELNENEHKLFNRSFDTATKVLNKSGKLKQTKLCLNKSWTTKKPESAKDNDTYKIKNHNSTDDGIIREIPNTKHFFKLPTKSNVQTIKAQHLNKTIAELPCATHARQHHDAADVKVNLEVFKGASNPLNKNGRHSLAITGRVDFCLKMHRKHSEVYAIWDVYGQLLKKSLGKQRCEFILLLRSGSGGPVLQGIYYDFSNKLACINTGCYVRIVGRFIGDNRLQTFKLQQMDDKVIDEHFTRIQNVTSFALLQNEIYGITE